MLAPEPPVAELAELYDSLVAIRPGLLTDKPNHGLTVLAPRRQAGRTAATG